MENKKKNTKDSKKAIIIGSVFILIVLGVVIVLGLLGSNNQDGALPFDGNHKEPIPEKKLQIVNPDSKSRNYAVMINNISVARPYQSGLQDAYILYEMLVEGGITRMLAIYKDANVNRIGPVRSARPYYLDYAMENDAYYIHYGWSEQAKNDISKFGINNVNGLTDSKTFWRDTTLKVASEHTAFTNTERMNNATQNFRSETKEKLLLNYSVDEINLNDEDSITANEIKTNFTASNYTSFTYDPEAKVYKRFVNGKEHTDYVTKKQYTAKNIIIYQVAVSTIDSYGRLSLNNVGTGKGYYITNGKAIPITWSKSSRDAQTVYKDSTGQEIKVNDGNTHIQIFPTNQQFTIS